MTPSDLGLPGRPAMRRAKSFFTLLTRSVPFAGEIECLTAARLLEPGSGGDVPQGAGVFARRLRGSPRDSNGEPLKGLPTRALARLSGRPDRRGQDCTAMGASARPLPAPFTQFTPYARMLWVGLVGAEVGAGCGPNTSAG